MMVGVWFRLRRYRLSPLTGAGNRFVPLRPAGPRGELTSVKGIPNTVLWSELIASATSSTRTKRNYHVSLGQLAIGVGLTVL